MTVIDSSVDRKPDGYMINCTHPTIVHDVLQSGSSFVRERCIGIQANTSSKSPEDLDGSEYLDTEDPEVFASLMIGLHRSFGTKILGGCCGTDEWHIRAVVKEAVRRRRRVYPRRRYE
jgi:homocysteine S-methyltransferase